MLDLNDPQTISILTFVLTFVAFVGIGAAIVLSRTATRRRAVERLSDEPVAPDVNEIDSKRGPLVELVSKIGLAAKSENVSPAFKSKLAHAGYYKQSAPAVFIGAKILLLVVGLASLPILLLCTSLPLHMTILLGLIIGTALFMIPNFVLASRKRARKAEILRYLPNAIDLLDVCVSAGMGLSAAWNMVAEEMFHVSQTFADEMALTNLEEHLGLPRATAMRNFAARTGVAEIATLSAVLVQSEKFGTDVATALRTFATSMRQDRSANSEELAEKTAVRMLFPMVMFIFPAMFVVVVGPTVMTLMPMIRGG